MGLKQDIAVVLLQHGAKKVVEHIAYKDAEKEMLRVNRTRLPEAEFCLLSAKHKSLSKLIKDGWRDALADPEIGRLIHFPQEFLGKKVLLFRFKKNDKKIGFVK